MRESDRCAGTRDELRAEGAAARREQTRGGGPPAQGRRRLPAGLALFLSAWVVYAAHFATNIVREHYPAFSLAERGTLRVDPYLGLHPDLFRYDDRGAFIDNNPGASLIGGLAYAPLRPLVDRVDAWVRSRRTGRTAGAVEYRDPRPLRRAFFRKVHERGLDVRFGLAAAAIQALGTAPFSAFAVWVMWWVLGRLGFERGRFVLALVYAFGTPIFFRSGYLNHNLFVAHFTLMAFALLLGDRGRSGQAIAAGACLGAGVLCDYSGTIPLAALGLYALARTPAPGPGARLRRGAWLALGAAGPIGALLGYQAWAFGNPFLPAQHYMPPTELSVRGWNGMDWPSPELLLRNLLDPRYGIFTFGPFLLLALAAPWLARRGVGRLGRAERRLAFGLFAALLVFTSANQYARLQWNTGFRMLAPALPLLFLAAAESWQRLPRPWAALAAGVAVAHSWCIAMTREDAFRALVEVARSGPVLPWVMSLWRAGGQYVAWIDRVGPSLASLPPLAAMFGVLGLLWWGPTGPRLAPAWRWPWSADAVRLPPAPGSAPGAGSGR